MKQPQELENRLIDFAVRIINVIEALPKSKAGNHIAGHLVRHGAPPRRSGMERMGRELDE